MFSRSVTTLATSLSCLVLFLSSADAFVEPSVSKTPIRNVSSTQANLFGFINEGKLALVKSLAGEYDQTAIKARIDGLIAENSVFMFSFTTWPFCVKAKEVLDGVGAKYTVVELDIDPDGKAIRAEMADFLGRTSVPAIWIGGDFIGGCNDGPKGGIVKLSESGQLDGMLKGVGAL